MKVFLFIIVFLAVGFLLIISNNSLSFYKAENVDKFADLSLDWIDQVYSSSQSVVGYIIKQEWLPK